MVICTGSIIDKKKRLRAELLERRKALTEGYLREAGESIQARLLSSERYASAESLFVYVSMPQEPSTARIISRALADGKSVYVPKCEGKTMLAVRISSMDELKPGKLGIPEPERADDTQTADELGLIIAPCVAASTDGRRLGHGGGYYDRFLRHERENAVCLCLGQLLCDDIPVDENDVRIKHIISE